MLRKLFRFPDPVNEIAARIVAAFVVLLTSVYLITESTLLLAFIAYGFVARVATGPTLSPIGQLVTRVIVPRLPVAERPTAGPPKRFAQGIGAVLSTTALGLALTGATTASLVLVAMITAAAALESFIGFCLGCAIFSRLMALGLVPQAVCEACADLSKRPRTQATKTGSNGDENNQYENNQNEKQRSLTI